MKNIFIGNLNVDITENAIRELFEAYGAVETVTVVKDRDTGHPRGFAFVEMPNDSDVERAIKALNETVLGQQALTINEARPKHQGLSGKAVERRNRSRQALDTRSHRKHHY